MIAFWCLLNSEFVGLYLMVVFCCQGRDCAQIGPPPQGEMVQVRWTDGLVYGAKFVAAHIIQMYQVLQQYSYSPSATWYLMQKEISLI